VESNITTIILAVIGVAGGAGAWQYYSKKLELKFQHNKESGKEQNVFRDQMLREMESVKHNLAEAQSKVLELTAEVHTLRERVKNLEKENDRLKSK
jgi:polyhydroxyalkanoate synthesis regulator phasin